MLFAKNKLRKVIKRKNILLMAIVLSVIFVEIPTVLSVPSYVSPLQSVYGSGSCGTCHIDPNGGGARNSYGTLFEDQPNHATDPINALIAIGPPPGITPSPTPTTSPTSTPTPSANPTSTPTPTSTPIPTLSTSLVPVINCYVLRGGVIIPGSTSTPGSTPTPVPTSIIPTPVPTGTTPAPVPTVPTPGLTVVLEDHFQGTSLNASTWPNLYTGPGWLPSGNAGSYYRVENIIVNNGLHLLMNRENYNGYSYTGGGLSTDIGITSGRVEVRARFPQSGQGLVGYLLLWPVDGSWPPELDFAETTGADSNLITFTQHWGTSSNPQAQTDKFTIDVTQYHVYIADITNGEITWYIDGNLIGTQTQNYDQNLKMKFAAGVWAGACDGSYGGCPSGAVLPQYLDIDYVKMYQR